MVCVQDEHGFFYGGFENGRPKLYGNKRKETKLEDSVADAVIRQLRDLGFGEWKKVAA